MSEEIKFVNKRATVEVQLPDGRVLSGPRGTPVEKFLRVLPEWDSSFIVGAVINSELRELTYPVDIDARIKLVTMNDPDGALIYRRSITFLLEAAFEDLFPYASLTVDHSVVTGGFYCQVYGRPPLTGRELTQLERHMRELVNLDLPLEKSQIPLDEAVKYFKNKGLDDKVRLLKYRQKNHLVMYRLGDHWDYHHGYMVPSTSFLKWFGLALWGAGFVLRYPRRQAPNCLQPLPETSKLMDTFVQYGNWLAKLGIDDVGALNSGIEAGRIREIILISEALQEQKIADIASQISAKKDKVRIILIAGPSSSGKTTFSKRLAVQLLAQGISPFPIEMDNFFVDRELTPKDEKGNYDFEALAALNIELMTKDLRALINGEEVQLPKYDFKSGRSMPGEIVRVNKNQLIILEGIHGIDPHLLPEIDREQTFRIYTSCLTQLNLDRYNRISTTDSRLIRRIVRDARERGYSAQQTIQRWDSVRTGEKKYIFPYQEHADEMFNSALVYELSALKPLVEPLLRQVPFGSSEYVEAKRLLALLEWFLPIEADMIPDNSLIREFIGGSILKEFHLWNGMVED